MAGTGGFAVIIGTAGFAGFAGAGGIALILGIAGFAGFVGAVRPASLVGEAGLLGFAGLTGFAGAGGASRPGHDRRDARLGRTRAGRGLSIGFEGVPCNSEATKKCQEFA